MTNAEIDKIILSADPGELHKLYMALREERRCDLERHRAAILERDTLRRELADQLGAVRTAEIRALESIKLRKGMPPILRTNAANEKPIKSGWIGNVLAAILLRFAKHSVRKNCHAQAEILYQAIALFKPRAFLFKQIGNMLYQQGLYVEAVTTLTEAQRLAPNDTEIQFLMDASRTGLTHHKI